MSENIFYYSVPIGREPGIYNTWDETQKNISGYFLSVLVIKLKVLSVYHPFVGILIYFGLELSMIIDNNLTTSFLIKTSPPARAYQRTGPICFEVFSKICRINL